MPESIEPGRTVDRLTDPDATEPPAAPAGATTSNFPPAPRPPGADATPAVGPGRYQLLGEIARGGMGAVLRGRDPDLGRELAVKVLLDRHADNPTVRRRFVEEAQVGGRLQHPGTVPVYELGRFEDGRPYFTMKLVEGRTLAALLAERPEPSYDRPRFVGIFLQICQTVAYAHGKGVIHRDLKPLNVMVGAFGEVQVMDWGLAKFISAPFSREPKATGETPGADAPGSPDLSIAGSVQGTPAYMPPEQARGEADRVDVRADVFGLGAILCETLSGRPPYTGSDAQSVYLQAVAGDLDDARSRLDGCGADAELVALAKACLAPEPTDRPRSAKEVAEAVAAYQAAVEARLRAAVVERAEAQVKAAEERKRRKVQLALAATVLLALTGAATGGLWLQRDRAERAAARADAEHRVAVAEGEAALLRDQGRWTEGLAAARRAVALAEDERVSPAVRERVGGLTAALEAVERAAAADRRLLDRLLEVRAPREGPTFRTDPSGRAVRVAEPTADEQYAEAFREWGLDIDSAPPEEAKARLAGRPAAVRAELAAALDAWAAERRRTGRGPGRWRLLTELAAAADPGAEAAELRPLLVGGSLGAEGAAGVVSRALLPLGELAGLAPGAGRTRLRALAADPKAAEGPAASVLLLAGALEEVGDGDRAERLLRAALRSRPSDPGLHYALGELLTRREPPDHAGAVEALAAARALRPALGAALSDALLAAGRVEQGLALWDWLAAHRPDDPIVLSRRGHALLKQDQPGPAEAAFRGAIRLRPNSPQAHHDLGNALGLQGRHAEAEVAFRMAVRLQPDLPGALYSLGTALLYQDRFAEAEAALRQAVRLFPDDNLAYGNLGAALYRQGRHAEAEAAFREAIRLTPNRAKDHSSLGAILKAQGKLAEAAAAYRAAVRLRPDNADDHYTLGVVLHNQGRINEAEAAYREALRLRPDHPAVLVNLGILLKNQQRFREAEAALREAVRLRPDLPQTHYNLGNALTAEGRFAEAEAAFREAIRLDPAEPDAHCHLALTLQRQGRFAEALESYRRGREVGSRQPGWRFPLAARAAEAVRMAALEARLPAVRLGVDRPADAAEALMLADTAGLKGLPALAARLAADAFAADPRRAGNLLADDRSNAAGHAARAAAGRGQDAQRLPEKARSGLPSQAMTWLRADLEAWTRFADNPAVRPRLRQALQHWRKDGDLAAVRDPAALARLPEAERAAWVRFWADTCRRSWRTPTRRSDPRPTKGGENGVPGRCRRGYPGRGTTDPEDVMATATITLTPADHGRRMTLADFEHAETQGGKLYELSRGIVIVSDVPDSRHFAQVDAIREQLYLYRAAHRDQIHLLAAGSDCKLLVSDTESERHPDVAVYKTPPPDNGAEVWAEWLPELVVEVVSESSVERDYVAKRREYLEMGIREYWIINALQGEMLALRRQRNRWVEQVVRPPVVYRTRLLPGLDFSVEAVFRAAGNR